jgi:hypothetical protein
MLWNSRYETCLGCGGSRYEVKQFNQRFAVITFQTELPKGWFRAGNVGAAYLPKGANAYISRALQQQYDP